MKVNETVIRSPSTVSDSNAELKKAIKHLNARMIEIEMKLEKFNGHGGPDIHAPFVVSVQYRES